MRRTIPALLVAAAALAAYANSLANGFVWDDPIILARQLGVFRGIGDVLVPPRDIPQFGPDYYRPLTIATYLLDRAVGGDRPFAFHLSVVLAHTVTSVLVYFLTLSLVRGRRPSRAGGTEVAALGAALLFALHPVHTESVAWAAGRADVLATGFLLAALLVLGRPRRTWAGSALAGVFTAGALGAKETGIALFPLLVLRDLLVPAVSRRGGGDWVRGFAGPLAAAAAYGLLRHRALGEVVGSAAESLPAGARSAADLIGAVGAYLAKLIWPVPLNAYIDHIPTGPLPIVLAGLLFAGLAASVWRWRTDPSDGLPLFALAWLALALVPSLAILWKIPDAPLAERYLYLPSVGFCLLAGDLLGRAWDAAGSGRARLAIGIAAGVALLACAAGTLRRNPVWRDDIALWEDTEPKSQLSGMAARGLGTAYQQAGRAAEARAAFERALTRRNDARGLQVAYNNLGTLAMYEGDYAGARRHYEAALVAAPNAADTLFNLGFAVVQGGGRSPVAVREAISLYRSAAALSPRDPDVEAGLAQAYEIIGERDAAALHARRALELGATGPTAESLRALLRSR